MSAQSRTYNTIANSFYGILASAITIVLNFVVRVVLVRQLGEEINGLNSLFLSITNVMLLMEMGIGSAMIIHLYEPVKQNDVLMIKGIMAFYRKVYRYVALIFSLLSLLVAFFLLEHLITTTLPMRRVRLYFILFSCSFTIDFLTYYKRSLLYAEQKNRISSLVTAGCEVVFRTLQIFVLLIYQEYALFIILLSIEKLSANLMSSYFVNKDFPYLKQHNTTILPKEKRQAIFATVKPLMVNQTANTVQQSSSSILISILLGSISIVGYFGNYLLISSVVMLAYSQLGGAFTTSFGNLATENDTWRMQMVYKKSAFILDWIACFCCSAFMVCASDFIHVVFGANFVLDAGSVFLIVLNMLVYLINIPVISVQNAMGLHRYDARNMVFQALSAIVLGYGLGLLWGMHGILLGTLLSIVAFTLLAKGVIIGQVAMGFERSDYLKFMGGEVIKILLVTASSFVLCIMISLPSSIWSIVIYFVIAALLSVTIPALLSFKTYEFKETMHMLKSMINKVLHK